MTYNRSKTLLILLLLVASEQTFSQDVHVKDLDFRGNQDISDGKLQKAIKTKSSPWYHSFLFWKEPEIFDEKVFLNDLLRIEKFYHNEGYLDAIVNDYELKYNEDGDKVSIAVEVEEGRPTTVQEVRFSRMNGDSQDSLPLDSLTLRNLVTSKDGKRYREEDLRNDYDAIIQKFSNSGYPYIEARVKPEIDRDSNSVVLNWLVDPGKYSEFADVAISGNESVSNDVILRGLEFREGQAFSQEKLQAAQSQIYRLELFQYVNMQAMNLRDQSAQIPIRINVKEKKLRAIELGVGYGSEEAFRIRGDWTHRNFLGGARILRAEVKHSTNILPLKAELELSQPFFFDNQNDLLLKPFFTWQDEESFELRRIGFETTLNRQLTAQTNVFITNRFSRDTVRVKNPGETEGLDNFYNKSVLLTGFRRNSTDQLFTPTRGSIARFVVEEAGLFFQSKFRYYKLFGEYRIYHKIAPGWILATRILAGTMSGFGGNQNTPVEERFYTGGSSSVRGWGRQELGPQRVNPETGEQTPAGGNNKLEGNIELRYPTYKNLNGAVFLDYGNVHEAWDGFHLLSLRYSIGIGIRYNTPIGPFRLDFAWKLNKQVSDVDRFQFHLSIGQAF